MDGLIIPMHEPHAIRRARERYGIEVTLLDLHMMQQVVAAGGSLLMKYNPKQNSKTYLVLCPSLAMAVVVVVGEEGRIVTILPKQKPLTGKIDATRYKSHNMNQSNGRRSRQPRPKERRAGNRMLEDEED